MDKIVYSGDSRSFLFSFILRFPRSWFFISQTTLNNTPWNPSNLMVNFVLTEKKINSEYHYLASVSFAHIRLNRHIANRKNRPIILTNIHNNFWLAYYDVTQTNYRLWSQRQRCMYFNIWAQYKKQNLAVTWPSVKMICLSKGLPYS